MSDARDVTAAQNSPDFAYGDRHARGWFNLPRTYSPFCPPKGPFRFVGDCKYASGRRSRILTVCLKSPGDCKYAAASSSRILTVRLVLQRVRSGLPETVCSCPVEGRVYIQSVSGLRGTAGTRLLPRPAIRRRQTAALGASPTCGAPLMSRWMFCICTSMFCRDLAQSSSVCECSLSLASGRSDLYRSACSSEAQ